MSKTDQLKKIEQDAKKNAEKQAAIQALQEKRMEDVVLKARVILPLIQEANFTIDKTKHAISTLAVTLQQGVYWLMKDNTVGDLKLSEKVSKDFPDADFFLKVIDLIKDVPLDLATESLQWLNEKVVATQRAEDQQRNFVDLKVNLDEVKNEPTQSPTV
jgi:hypothetical protein